MSERRIVIFGWSTSVHVMRWVEGMSRRGYKIKVISSGGKPIDGILTVTLPRKNHWSYFLNASKAAKEARDFKPDLIHVHYAGGFGLWGNRVNFKPYLISVWGADVIDLPEKISYRPFIKRSLKKATWISATSQMLKRTTVRLVPETESKIEVIPFGVKIPDSYTPPPSGDVIKILYMKMHTFKYGPDVLLRAIAKVRKVYRKISLSMAGEGEKTAYLKRMVKELDLEDCVTFTGFLPNEKMYDLIKSHDLMVMPSVMDSESFGVAVVEASACGRPVIASDVGGVNEVLIDGKNGFLIPRNDDNILAESILRMIGDRDLMLKMGEEGFRFAKENYDWEMSLDKMSALYERLIDEHK